ncbi:MAG: hypothetical protein JWP64_4217 [Pseudonocardia sp.]|uniref:hypothetical protein n=1 Tax=Pseudonocardia sp. TaxID=60912 RepID=UPI00260F68AA|nr:hypothetical protein [Pseudonocardia sp.]MCU1629268.1 hypothetical protein [Pseudonocardia sp.]
MRADEQHRRVDGSTGAGVVERDVGELPGTANPQRTDAHPARGGVGEQQGAPGVRSGPPPGAADEPRAPPGSPGPGDEGGQGRIRVPVHGARPGAEMLDAEQPGVREGVAGQRFPEPGGHR